MGSKGGAVIQRVPIFPYQIREYVSILFHFDLANAGYVQEFPLINGFLPAHIP
jgi:hypothetical protein